MSNQISLIQITTKNQIDNPPPLPGTLPPVHALTKGTSTTYRTTTTSTVTQLQQQFEQPNYANNTSGGGSGGYKMSAPQQRTTIWHQSYDGVTANNNGNTSTGYGMAGDNDFGSTAG
jgi:hypothetical protein